MKQSGLWTARLVTLSALCVIAVGVEAQTLRTTGVPFRPDIRALGMGGAYLAAGSNGGAFIYNPALLNQSHTDISLSNMLGVAHNVTNVYSFLSDNQTKLENFDNLTQAQETELYNDLAPIDGEKVNFRFSSMLNFVTHNFGVAAYFSGRAGAGVDRGIFEPRVLADGTGDFVLMLGLARSISENTAVGVNIKAVNRRSADFRVGVTKVGNVYDSTIDSLKIGKTGYALDVGLLHRLGRHTNVGVVVQDLHGQVGDDKFPMNLKLGIATNPISRLTLAMDIVDLLNKDDVSIFNRVFMGGEFRIPLISLRGGVYQGYPSFGAGLNLKIFKVDYAFYQVENGRQPGISGMSQHEVQLKLGWGW